MNTKLILLEIDNYSSSSPTDSKNSLDSLSPPILTVHHS